MATTGYLVRDEHGEVSGLRGLIMDIQERRLAQLQLEREVITDVLTGLPNRRWLLAQLQQAVDAGQPCAVGMLDLDGFKDINDVHGHPVGDLLLQVVAGRMRAFLPAGLPLARLGGDEFAFVAPGGRLHEALGLAQGLV